MVSQHWVLMLSFWYHFHLWLCYKLIVLYNQYYIMKLWFITWLLCFCNTHSDMEDNLSLKNSTNTPIDHKRKLEADYTPHDLVQHEKLPYIVYKWSSYSYSYLPEWVCDCWCFVFQSWILPLHYGICRCCGVYALCCDSPCVIYESRLEHLRRCLYVLRVIIFNNNKKTKKNYYLFWF